MLKNKFQLNEDKCLQQAKYYIQKNLSKNLRLFDISKNCGLSSSQLQRKFKMHYNMNFYEYITTLRMQEAALLLKKTQYPIQIVALMAGYQNQFGFSHQFRETWNKSPKEFKNSCS